MLEDMLSPNPLKPIQRSTSAERLATFQKNSNNIYNKYSPFTSYGGIGPSQPFVYTKISDSTFSKNLTRYDSYAAPIGSTVRDLQRVGQYAITGYGLLFIGKQLLLQQKNAFNETRIYNPLSLLKATARPGSLGLIDYPQRHLETSGGLLNFFKDALLSTIGFQTKDSEKPRIEGTATGVGGVAYSNYVGVHGGGRAGLLRLGTAKSASSIFESTWVTSPDQSGTNGGFLANIGKALVNKLKSLIPSTNPLGAFGGSPGETWVYRPEYKAGKDGAYYAFLSDNSGFLTVNAPSSQLFYNDKTYANANAAGKSTVKLASDYHKYNPQRQSDRSSRVWYADTDKIAKDDVGVKDIDGNANNLKNLTTRMVKSIDSFKKEANQFRRSAERYSEIEDSRGVKYPSYKDIPSSEAYTFGARIGAIGSIERENWFAKASGIKRTNMGSYKVETDSHDRYNALGVLNGKRDEEPSDLTQGRNGELKSQSRDLIFFYFYDLINEVYIPFRATIKGLSDQHQADWEELSYIGRADKLFLYKGFSRDVNFSFTVYANSAIEMLPMWERVNYLVGLTRPSKYTGAIKQTEGQKNINQAKQVTIEQMNATEDSEQQEALGEVLKNLDNAEKNVTATGREGKFIYPPMTTFRLGDMYVDQPCIISSVGVNISDDANWETLRADKYNYHASSTKEISFDDTKARQLPLQVEVSVTLKILEKALSLGSNAHFGKTTYDTNGKETGKWIL